MFKSNAQAVFEVPLLGAGETVTFPVTGIALRDSWGMELLPWVIW